MTMVTNAAVTAAAAAALDDNLWKEGHFMIWLHEGNKFCLII